MVRIAYEKGRIAKMSLVFDMIPLSPLLTMHLKSKHCYRVNKLMPYNKCIIMSIRLQIIVFH